MIPLHLHNLLIWPHMIHIWCACVSNNIKITNKSSTKEIDTFWSTKHFEHCLEDHNLFHQLNLKLWYAGHAIITWLHSVFWHDQFSCEPYIAHESTPSSNSPLNHFITSEHRVWVTTYYHDHLWCFRSDTIYTYTGYLRLLYNIPVRNRWLS